MESDKVQKTDKQSPVSAAMFVANNVAIQCSLAIGAVNDPLEHEADAMADKVMRMPDSSLVQRKCTHCEEEEKLQRKPLVSFIQMKGCEGNMAASDAVTNQINATKGGGFAIDNGTKNFMESRFGTDFSAIRIHTGDYAVQMNKELNAKAFTAGNNIYFNSGKYAPEGDGGKHLLAHELTHTVQQDNKVKRQAAPKKNSKTFTHHKVNVLIRNSCDDPAFGLPIVERDFKRALDKIFDSDCIEESRRKAIQANLVKNGYDVRCRDSAKLDNAGACAESTGFSIPANILTLGSNAFAGGDCGDLASTILHEIIHVTRGRFNEDVSASCEASCFKFGSASPDLCRDIDVYGKKH